MKRPAIEKRKISINRDRCISILMIFENGFLIAHMEEIKGMLDTEYNEVEVNEAFKEEGRQEGKAEREALKLEIDRLRKENEELKKLTVV